MKNSTRIITTIAVLLFGVTVIVGIVALPSIRGIAHLAKEIQAEHDRIEPIVNRTLRYRSIKEDVESAKRELPKLTTLLIPEGQEVLLFTDLEKKSKQVNLVQKLQVGERNLKNTLNTLPLSFTLQGTFLNTLRYIIELERMPILLTIENIQIQTASDQTDLNFPHITTLQGHAITVPPSSL